MSSSPSTHVEEGLDITLPEFRGLPSVRLEMSSLKTAERRLIEAKTVTPSTYNELEYVFNEAYREIKKNLSVIGYQILKTQNELEKSKASALLDKYPEFLKDKGSKFDNASTRDAFLARDEDYMSAKERLDTLKALEIFLEGKVKVMENVSRYMKTAMQLIIRSGSSDLPYKR